MSLVSYAYITLSGTIIPDTLDILVEVENEYKAALGADLIVTPDTPQGVLIAAETETRDAIARNNATLANQINPNLAGGVYLDAILALTGAERNPQIFSTAPCALAGVATTPIPAGTIFRDVNGNEWQTETIVTLDGDGNATVTVQALTAGSITAAENTITTIVTDILGLETVTNTEAATVGQATQTDEATRIYRRNTLALQGQGLAEAILSGLNATLGVRSAKFLENPTGMTVVKQNVTLVPHSMWACVDGGSDTDIANTLTIKKNGGCAYNGDVTVPTTNPFSGQIIDVLFDRPTPVPVLARVTISADISAADPVGSVTADILAYADGLLNNEPGFVTGAQVSPFELAGAITCQTPTIFVKKLEVSYADSISYETTELFIEIFEIPTIDAGSITVIVE